MRASNKILSVDFGTTRCKVGVFDERGKVLAHKEGAYAILYSDSGLLEQDDKEWQATFFGCLSSLNSTAKVGVDMVAITGQGSTAICLDREGKVLAPIISHLDTRPHAYGGKINSGVGNLGYVPSKMLASLLWIKENRPRVFRRLHHVADVREYLGYLLTGKVTYDSASYSPNILAKSLDLTGLGENVLGEPHDNSSPVGVLNVQSARRTGMKKGTPVLIAPFDGMCGVVGAGVDKVGLVADIVGSTEVVSTPVPTGSPLGIIPHVVKGLSLSYMSPPLGLLYQWFRDEFYGMSDKAFSVMEEDAISTPAGCGGLLCVPQVRYEGFHSRSALSFHNFTTSRKRSEMGRAVMEGIALYVCDALQKLRNAGMELTQVRIGGGGAQSDLWNQIRADVYGLEVAVPQTVETTCLGSAIFAAVALGVYGQFVEACSKMVRPTRFFRPRERNRDSYAEMYRRFKLARNAPEE